MHKRDLTDTIAAPATPIGEGGIGIVRISGAKALAIADRIFRAKDGSRPSDCGAYTTHYGHIIIPDTRDARRVTHDVIIDEVLLTVMRAPKSYTREDVVEINCHGGIQAVKDVLELVMREGARLAEPGEFTKRAFLNGRLDLVQAEAVLDVIRARTEGSLKAAMASLNGKLSAQISDILDKLIDIAAHIEAAVDFPEEDTRIIEEEALPRRLDALIKRIKYLIDSFNDGIVLREGVLAVICGKPNAGKSSLMNELLKRDRVIVAPVPGTTRDAVEEMISIRGVPVRLVDTAGIGATADELGGISAGKSVFYIKSSDIAVLVLDASTELNEDDLAMIRLVEGKKKVVVVNKTDLGKRIDRKSISALFKKDAIIEASVRTKDGIEAVEEALRNAVYSGKYAQGAGAIVTNARHKELLGKALGNMLSAAELIGREPHPELAAIDIKEAAFDLGLVIGRSVSDDVLDRIFENFCIGK
jgi:tRNA modification GTPase